jgi:rod shape determining protein RodA
MKAFFGAVARYFRQTDIILIIIALSASAFGSVMVYSATHGSKTHLITQTAAILLGVVCMVVLSRIDYHEIADLWKYLAIAGVVLLLLPYVHPLHVAGSADLSWLNLNFMTVQPAELVKLIFIFTFSKHYDMVKENLRSVRNVLLLCLHAAVPIGIIIMQHDMGMALVFIMIFIFMMFAGSVQLRYFAVAAVLLLVSAPTLWNHLGVTQKTRILALFDPTNPLYASTAEQQVDAQNAIGSGQIWGYGLFKGPRTQSAYSLGLLPERQNDMIFAVVGEELGLVGCMAVIAVLTALLLRLIYDASRSRDALGSMICVGVFSSFAVQMMINLGMALSMMPVIGIALPFFSSGGTTTLSSYIAVGMALSVYMHRKTSMFASQPAEGK